MAERVCPVWMGYLLASPLRRLGHKPKKLLGPHLRSGMTVLDIGPGMGFFSLPMASMVGPEGKVICVDMQPGMLDRLKRRAHKAGLEDIIETRLCTAGSLGIDDMEGRIDFVLAFAVVHEVPDAQSLFQQIRQGLRPGSSCLVAEPKGHVKQEDFRNMISMAQALGFAVADRPAVWGSLAVLLTRR